MSDTFDDICRELSANSVYQALDCKSVFLETVGETVVGPSRSVLRHCIPSHSSKRKDLEVGATNSHAAWFLNNDDKERLFLRIKHKSGGATVAINSHSYS